MERKKSLMRPLQYILCEIRMWKLVSRTILGLSIQNRNNSFFDFFSFLSREEIIAMLLIVEEEGGKENTRFSDFRSYVLRYTNVFLVLLRLLAVAFCFPGLFFLPSIQLQHNRGGKSSIGIS